MTDFNRDEDYYAEFKVMVRERMPNGAQVTTDLKAAFDKFFAEEGIILSPREKGRLFQLIIKDLAAEMQTEAERIQP
jgi:hypothetical protein